MQNQENEQSALQVAAQTAKDAAALAKMTAQAASGNAVGAAVTAAQNLSLLKRGLALLLAIVTLITCCLCAVPNMIWEAAEQSKELIQEAADDIEDTTELIGNSIYYVFYGTSDGHEGLSGILSALPRTVDTLLGIFHAGWSFFTTGEISDEVKESMSASTQVLVEQIYHGSQDRYYKEAQAGTIEGSDGSAGMGLALANKKAATRLRLQGRISDIRDSIEKDFDAQVALYGKDENFCNITETNLTDQIVNLMLALYMVQTNGDLKTTTLAEYDNWLGKSKQTWMDSGPFNRNKYKEVPALLSGDSYADNELCWLEPVYHWGGEFLPQDVYEEYEVLVNAALEAESRLDSHFTANDRYEIRQKVMHGKYAMRSSSELADVDYQYPEECTAAAYHTNFAQVWYNQDSGNYYDRGSLDVMVYPSPHIKYEYKTRIVTHEDGSIEIIEQFYAYYQIKALEIGGDGEWLAESETILKDIVRLTDGAIFLSGEPAAGFSLVPSFLSRLSSFFVRTETIAPRPVLALQSSALDGNQYAKWSDWERKRGWQEKYLKDLLQILEKLHHSSSVLFGSGGSGQQLVSVAMGEIGQGEPTGNNDSKYNVWFGMMKQPWCAMFVSWCAEQCGYLESGLFPRAAHSASFWNHVLDNPDKGSLYTPADVRSGAVTPVAGDILIISPVNNQEASSNTVHADDSASGTRHVCIVTGYDSSGGLIATIDGNSSDMVKENTYSIAPNSMDRNIWGFVRPAYPSAGVEISGGIPHTVSGLDMDTDGSSDPADKDDPYYQAQTSLQTKDGHYIDASKVNYVVVAKGQGASLLGCLVTIKDLSSGTVINCVSADTGPRSNDWNEVSVCAARSLGYTVSGLCGVSTDKQFMITYYPDCRLTLYAEGHGEINTQINEQAAQYASSVDGGSSHYKPNFDAGSGGSIT